MQSIGGKKRGATSSSELTKVLKNHAVAVNYSHNFTKTRGTTSTNDIVQFKSDLNIFSEVTGTRLSGEDYNPDGTNPPILEETLVYNKTLIAAFLYYWNYPWSQNFNPSAPAEWWINSGFGAYVPAEGTWGVGNLDDPTYNENLSKYDAEVLTEEPVPPTIKTQAPFPNGVAGYFRTLQQAGNKVLLSLGGATFDSVISNAIPGEATGSNVGQSFANAFLGVTSASNPLGWQPMRDTSNVPFYFDGIDFDIEAKNQNGETLFGNATVLGINAMIQQIRTLCETAIITTAPEPTYIAQNYGLDTAVPTVFNANGNYTAYLGTQTAPSWGAGTKQNLSALLLSESGFPALFDANNIGTFSKLLVQFYNQGVGFYPSPPPYFPPQPTNTNTGYLFPHMLAEWAWLALNATTTVKPKIYIGLLADSVGGNYPAPNELPTPSDLGSNLDLCITEAQRQLVSVCSAILSPSQWLGGLMFWDSPKANTYASNVLSNTTLTPKDVVFYGGQDSSVPFGPGTNPNWESL
jgi:hypothetical protein